MDYGVSAFMRRFYSYGAVFWLGNAACRELLLKELTSEIIRLFVSTMTVVRHVWCWRDNMSGIEQALKTCLVSTMTCPGSKNR